MRILIAIYDPATADDTLNCAAQFSCRTDEMCQVIVIREKSKSAWHAEALIERAQQILGPSNFTVRQCTGDIPRVVMAELKQAKYDLLITGESQASSGGIHSLRERIAHRLAEQSPCPVLVVRSPVRPFKRILMCDSGAETSVLRRFTLQVAELISGEEEITILHVMSQISAGPGVADRQLLADAQELIAEDAPEGRLLAQDMRLLERQGIHPIGKVRHGLVVDEILAEARSGDYDLVVIGAHRGVGWQRFLLDDLAHKILAQMDRPVLLVR
jgi:nucleotide-binding universal stress UspA family protein